jgi:hypothetical protein
MNNDILADLQLYQRLGLTPIPLEPRSKKFLVKRGDGWNPIPEELASWAAKPGLNWAVRWGPELAVLDFDCQDTYHKSARKHALPPGCPVVRTGWGFHIWGKPLKPMGSQRLDGIEVKCMGSYIVAPPSAHPNQDNHCKSLRSCSGNFSRHSQLLRSCAEINNQQNQPRAGHSETVRLSGRTSVQPKSRQQGLPDLQETEQGGRVKR